MIQQTNRRKIVNDPVYGFIHINSDLIFELVEHPWFQRLRRIKQLGLTNLVYPGAMHTRFQHALGAMYLMDQAIQVIRSKGQEISEAEAEAVKVAILLHDIGHGPFSHALEFSIIEHYTHEDLSVLLMNGLNTVFDGKLSLAIDIFKDKYHKRFLHQLVSGQLDMDRLDYLRRDSFFTGVTEGIVGSDRIIKMLRVIDDRLVVEAKGIYSIEKFLIARRLMYWQVYLHKTVLSAENLLVNILRRAKYLTLNNIGLFATPALHFFLTKKFGKNDFDTNNEGMMREIISNFVLLDDTDIISAIKVWQSHEDVVLSKLCNFLNNRNLFKIELQQQPFDEAQVKQLQKQTATLFGIGLDDAPYFVFSDTISSHTYSASDNNITIVYNNGTLSDIAEASDILNIQVLSKKVTKHFLCYPKEVR